MLLLCFSALFVACRAAVAADAITSLPGWNGPLPSKQYSGFIPSAPGHQMHYWLVESEGDPINDPIVLWVQGGPGASSMLGLFTENGPFYLNEDSLNGTNVPTLFRNQYGWQQYATMLYWESPAGVGFSNCGSGSCPSWNDTTATIENYQFLCNFFSLYPEYSKNDFYLTGESYAGVYIGTLVDMILNNPICPLNLRGFAIGNCCTGTQVGTCSPGRMYHTLRQLATHDMVSENLYNLVQASCGDSMGLTKPSVECQNLLRNVSNEAGAYNNYDIYDTCGPPTNTFIQQACDTGSDWACNFLTPTEKRRHERRKEIHAQHGIPFPYEGRLNSPRVTEELGDFVCGGEDALNVYLSNTQVQAAIHMPVGYNWPGAGISYTRTEPDLISKYPSFINKFRVLIYSGDFDAQIPAIGTEEWTRGLGYKAKAPWRPWLLPNNQVAGYVTEYDVMTEFTFLTIKAAGHEAPTYRPVESLAMFQKFIKNQPY